VTAWVKGKRYKPDIDVRLSPGPKFYLQAKNRSNMLLLLNRLLTNFRCDKNTLLGMLQHTIK